MNLSTYIGDTPTLAIPLEWDGEAFAAGTAWALIFTAKRQENDADEDAVFQKATGAGITHSGYTAMVTLVEEDTIEENPADLFYDVQAQNVTDGRVYTVADGRLELTRDKTRKTTTSVPVHTTTPPLPFGPTLPAGLETITSIIITAGDDLEIVKNGITYYLPLYRRA